ncbi:hypothetical protein AAMO2058_001382500 [Amorphochlora amoebiformis]
MESCPPWSQRVWRGLLQRMVLLSSFLAVTSVECKIWGSPRQVNYNGYLFNLRFDTREGSMFEQHTFADTVTGTQMINFRFIGKLTRSVNPRLCAWANYNNFNKDIFQPSDFLDRAPLGPENGMPEVSCAQLSEEEFQDPKTQKKMKQFKIQRSLGNYPMFRKNGEYGHNDGRYSISKDRYSLCGNPFYLEKDQALLIDGSIPLGSKMMLHCQSGNRTDFAPVGLFNIDCRKGGEAGPYDSNSATKYKGVIGSLLEPYKTTPS